MDSPANRTAPQAASSGAADALLLDFDGTLVAIDRRPDAVSVPDELRDLIARACDRLDGRLAIISGRSLAQLDGLWGETLRPMTVAASHGLELRSNGVLDAPASDNLFHALAAKARAHFARFPGVVIETKSFGLAVHYRLDPLRRRDVEAWVETEAAHAHLVMQEGDMVREIRLAGPDKGDAVRKIMQRPPFAGSRPTYIGDDLTDIAALAAARSLGGRGIAVGPRIAAHADETVSDIAAVWRRIAAMIA